MQEVAVLDREQEQAAIDEAEELLVQVHRLQAAVLEPPAQRVVGRVGDEAVAERDERLGHALSQLAAGALAGLVRLAPPALEDAGGGAASVTRLEAGAVGEQPEGGEVRENLVLEGALEVELDPGRAGEARVVAQDAQGQAVGDEAPKRVVRGVQVLLDKAPGRAAPALLAALRTGLVEVEAGRQQDQRHGAFAGAVGEREDCARRG